MFLIILLWQGNQRLDFSIHCNLTVVAFNRAQMNEILSYQRGYLINDLYKMIKSANKNNFLIPELGYVQHSFLLGFVFAGVFVLFDRNWDLSAGPHAGNASPLRNKCAAYSCPSKRPQWYYKMKQERGLEN